MNSCTDFDPGSGQGIVQGPPVSGNLLKGDRVMYRSGVMTALMALPVIVVLAPQALAEKNAAEKKAVKVLKDWKGSVADQDLSKDTPEYIADAKSLDKLWKKWKIEGKVPEVDFKKEIVIVTTTVGSRLSLSAKLNDKGNLEMLGVATRDLAPGFRYVIATVSREGVKTVNGKELKEATDKE
jgi:hypothetical protein